MEDFEEGTSILKPVVIDGRVQGLKQVIHFVSIQRTVFLQKGLGTRALRVTSSSLIQEDSAPPRSFEIQVIML